ncbi:hypothetical protein RE476_02605 [Methanolobus mangrovi]|uniref:Uncharacterized protein n=1 Tax=Methanolobus mangrovi TaxID=3072977 RepID=A0AA51YJL0_9EURY|nr:hypothetical protein [Methanolobus mangrovi]WMW22730.1 hypothetical protein RE476_02605 [Methanolobus mangrovi]
MVRDMIREHRNNVWVIRTGYCGQQEAACLENGYVSFDLNLHITDLFGKELLEMKNQPQDYKRYLHFGDKYRDFDQRFRKEFEDALKNVDYSADRPEVVKKMKRLNSKLKQFDEEVKQFDATMRKFDDFERLEQMKKALVTRLSSPPINLLESWAKDVLHFTNDIRIYDLVVLPIMSEQKVAIGRVKDHYQYREGKGVLSHHRRVDWHDTRVPIENMFFGFEKILESDSSITLLDGDEREFVLGIVIDDTF